MSDSATKIDCMQCQHYYVTWDAQRHGCRYFGFKSLQSPALSVVESSGQACQAFSAKQPSPRAPFQKPPKKGGWVA